MQPVIPYPLRARLAFKPRTWSLTYLIAPLLALWVLVLFARSLGDYFSGDDFALLSLFANRPPLHFLGLFFAPWTERVFGAPTDELRPLLAASYQWDWFWGGGSPVAFHISNLVFHWVATLLVYRLAREIAGLAVAGACLAAALFAVLPIHVETVGWISGRADSVPAIFSLATLLAYARWRRTASRLAYVAALICCLGALYSKQSAVILPVVLAAYDLQVGRLNLRTSWRAALPWLGFLLLTAGYLLERRLLFSSVLREETLSVATTSLLVPLQLAHLSMLLTGTEWLLPQQALTDNLSVLLSTRGLACLGLLLVALAALVVFRLRDLERGPASRLRATFGFFGFTWWVLNTAPLLVTYPSPRHLYLAGAGFAICLALLLTLPRRGLAGRVALVGTVLLITSYALVGQRGLQAWNVATSVSAVAARDLQHEVRDAPPGGLIVAVAPAAGTDRWFSTWIWGWSLPFVLQPPFADQALSGQALLINPYTVDCCTVAQWFERTHRAVRDWSERPDRPTVVVLAWDPASGTLTRQSSLDHPTLPERAAALLTTTTPIELDTALRALVQPEPLPATVGQGPS